MSSLQKIFGIILCLGSLVFTWARASVEFDKERIEAGKDFTLIFVVPKPEIPPNHGVPKIADAPGFTQKSIDSADDHVNDFFMGSYQVRKYKFHMTAPKDPGQYQLAMTWEINGNVQSLGKVNVPVARSLDASALQVLLTPSKRTVYEGEQFSLAMTLLTYENFQGGLNLGGIDLGNDFVAHRGDLGGLKFERSKRPGVQGEASAKIAWVAPIRAGALEIPELKFKYQKMGAMKEVHKQMGNFSFSSVSQQPEEATATSGKVQIQALPLPMEGKPKSFSGLVGQYTFDAKIDKTSLQVGEALTLLIKMRGNGKPGAIPDPEMPDFSDFRSVPPETQLNKTIVDGMVFTDRSLKVFLYPKKKGEFKIAPIHFSWFDPAKKKYVEVSSKEFSIKVDKGDITQAAVSGGQSVTPVANVVEQKDIEKLGEDIRFIHEPMVVRDESQRLVYKAWYWILLVLPFVLAWGAGLLRTRRLRQLEDGAFQRRTKAQSSLQLAWGAAATAKAAGEAKKMFAEFERGLITYVSDLLNIDLGGMTREKMSSALSEVKVAPALIEEFAKILEVCDQARFSPLGTSLDEASRIEERVRKLTDEFGRLV